MTTGYIRKQIILEKEQSIQLSRIAKKEGVTFSELVRDYLNSQLRARTYREMETAADALLKDYCSDNDLTAMTTLDGEDVIDG